MKKFVLVLVACVLLPIAACSIFSMTTCGAVLVKMGQKSPASATVSVGHTSPDEFAASTPAESGVVQPAPVTASVVTFTKDTLLDVCVDFTITPPQGADAGADFLDGFVESVIKGKKGMSRLYKLCTEQFRTNPALATCTVHISEHMVKGDSGVERGTYEIQMASRYYNLDTITNSDVDMKECLDMKGDWEAVDRDSDEYRQAVRARARREVDKLQKAVGQ